MTIDASCSPKTSSAWLQASGDTPKALRTTAAVDARSRQEELHEDRAHAVDDRRQMEGDCPHPVGQHRTVELDPVPRENLRLPIERHMLAELGDLHLRQQRLGRGAALDQMSGRRRLGHARAAFRAGIAGTHGLDDAILGGRHVKAV